MGESEKIAEFVSFCIEMYAREYNMTGGETATLFESNHLIDYLLDNYLELHSQGKEYIIPLLHGFICEGKDK